jgi:hypothetical protein
VINFRAVAKYLVIRSGILSISALNHLLETAHKLNLGEPIGVYGYPPDDDGQCFLEWGIVCERGIVCAREVQDTEIYPGLSDRGPYLPGSEFGPAEKPEKP